VRILKGVDAKYQDFTLLIPVIELGSARELAIKTIGITTTHYGPDAVPPTRGLLEEYAVAKLSGKAKFIES
jgi:hypothetical protein